MVATKGSDLDLGLIVDFFGKLTSRGLITRTGRQALFEGKHNFVAFAMKNTRS